MAQMASNTRGQTLAVAERKKAIKLAKKFAVFFSSLHAFVVTQGV